jgi:hypothetical protein
MDKECDVGVQCAYSNRHGDSVSIPDGDSTMTHMSSRIVEQGLNVKIWNIDAHAKYDQNRRGYEGRVGKYLPTGAQSQLFIDKTRLTSSKITHSFVDAFSVSLSIS